MNDDSSAKRASSQYGGNILRYYIFNLMFGFATGSLAIWVLFVIDKHGFSLSLIAFLNIVFFLTMTLGEVPTGIVADVYGRKISLAFGAIFLSCGYLLFSFAPDLFLLLVSYILAGIGFTFLSGAQEALLFESLVKDQRGDEYTRITGRATALRFGVAAVGTVLTGFFATIDIALPTIISGITFGLMLIVIFTFKEPAISETNESATRGYFKTLRDAVHTIRQQRTLRYAIVYLTLISLFSWLINSQFVQPYARGLGVPLALIGIALMLMRLSNMLGSAKASHIADKLGERSTLFAIPLITIFCLILLVVWQAIPALIGVAVITFVAAVMRPIVLNIIQNQVADQMRATVLSLQNLVFTLVLSVTQPLFGFIADEGGFSAMYGAMAIALTLAMLIFVVMNRGAFPPVPLVTATAIETGEVILND